MNEISSWIEAHSTRIIENIDQESIDVYNFLKNEHAASNVAKNPLFQFVYRSYYRLDNAGLTSEFKKEYFIILQEWRMSREFDFRAVLERLYRIQNRKGQNKLQFSFATKMANTINDKSPIYDSYVAKMFSLSKPSSKKLEDRISKYLMQLNSIEKGYKQLTEQKLLPNTLRLFDKTFTSSRLSEMKKLDFIFWSSGKLRENE